MSAFPANRRWWMVPIVALLTTAFAAIALATVWPPRPRVTLNHLKDVVPVHFSPDSRMLLVVPWVSSSDNRKNDEGFLYDVDSGRQVVHFKRSTASFAQSAWLPDGRLAYIGSDGCLEFFDPITQRAEPGHISGISPPVALTVSSDGTQIATKPALSNSDRCIHVCDLATGRSRVRLDPGERWESRFDEVRLSRDGKIVSAISHTYHELTVTTWERFEWKTWSCSSGDLAFRAVALAPDLTTVAFGKPDHRAVIRDLNSGEERVLLEDPSLGVVHLEFSSDGKTLAIGRRSIIALMLTATTADPEVRETIFVDVATGNQKMVLKDSCHGMFSPDGQTWAVNTLDGIQLWDLPTRKPLGVILGLAACIGLLAGMACWCWLRRPSWLVEK